MICRTCGADVPEGSANCLTCGAPVDNTPICAYCGAPLSADSAFCTNCGNKQPEPVAEETAAPNLCPHCGATLAEDSAFCVICGNAVGVVAPVVETPVRTRAPKEPGTSFFDKLPISKNLAIFGGAGVLAVILLVVILCIALSGGAESVAVDYWEAKLEGDVDAVIELIDEELLDACYGKKSTYNRAVETLEDSMENLQKSAKKNYGKNWDYSVEAVYVNELYGDDLDDLIEEVEKSYDTEIEEAVDVIVLIEYQGDEGDHAVTKTVTVYKVNGGWTLDPYCLMY